jgi:hypothetical protein
MCVDCVLASPRIAQVDPRDEPLSEVVLSHGVTTRGRSYLGKKRRVEVIVFKKKIPIRPNLGDEIQFKRGRFATP